MLLIIIEHHHILIRHLQHLCNWLLGILLSFNHYSLKMLLLQNTRQSLIQVYKKITMYYLSLVIGIQEEGHEMPLRRLSFQLKLLVLLLIDIIYQVIMIEVYVNCCYSKSVFFIYYDKMWTYPSKSNLW